VLTYLHDALLCLKDVELNKKVKQLICLGEQYLLKVQNEDGSWGGDKAIEGSIEETSLSITALQKSEFEIQRRKGFDWLDTFFKINGLKAAPIGLYFASLWYNEKLYPLTTYLEAVVKNLDNKNQ
jgi:squalene-hopene/tetraprenyl-beta-curcumene cyclase